MKEKFAKMKSKLVRLVIAVPEILTIVMVPLPVLWPVLLPVLLQHGVDPTGQTQMMVELKSMMVNAGKSISATKYDGFTHLHLTMCRLLQ